VPPTYCGWRKPKLKGKPVRVRVRVRARVEGEAFTV